MTVKTIKASGGDYSSLSSWEAAAPGTLTDTYEAECDNFALNDTTAFSGITTSATNYIRVAAASGSQHDGRSRDVSGTGFQVYQTASVAVFRVVVNHIRFEGLDIKQSGTASPVALFSPFGAGSDIRITNCILHNVLTGTGYTLSVSFANVNATLTNTIIYGYQRSMDSRNATSVAVNNCVFWRHADQLGVVSTGELVCKNTYSGKASGTSEDFWTAGASPGGNNNASSDSSATTDYTSSLTAVAGSAVFVSVTPGAEDFRLQTGANALVDAGATLTTATDIIGTSRPQGSAWDIGAFERASTGVSGTTYYQTLTASFTGNALTIKQVRKALSASAPFRAVVQKRLGKKLLASFIANGSMSKAKVKLMLLTASFSANSAVVRRVGKRLSASFTGHGAVGKRASKTLTATFTAHASRVAQVRKILTASFAAHSGVSMGRLYRRLLTASFATNATVTRRINKTLTAPFSVQGAFTKAATVANIWIKKAAATASWAAVAGSSAVWTAADKATAIWNRE